MVESLLIRYAQSLIPSLCRATSRLAMQSPLSVTVLKMELTTGLCEILGAPIGANKATSVFGAELTNVWLIFGLLGPKLFDPI